MNVETGERRSGEVLERIGMPHKPKTIIVNRTFYHYFMSPQKDQLRHFIEQLKWHYLIIFKLCGIGVWVRVAGGLDSTGCVWLSVYVCVLCR